MTPEQRVLAAAVRYLKAMQAAGEPIWWVKLHGGPMQRAGLPDLIICYRGRFCGIEVKAPDGVATDLQLHTLCKIHEAGGKSRVVRSVEEVKEVLGDV